VYLDLCNIVVDNSMKKDQISELIEKYLAGGCNFEEKQIIEKWYETLTETEKEFYGGSLHDIQLSKERSLQAVQKKLGIFPETESVSGKKNLSWLRWVAAASIILVAGVAIKYLNSKPQVTYTLVSTRSREIKHIQLPDGSEVWLNAGSTLRFANNYNQTNREVYLNGEGYFDVRHDKSKPFNVYTGKIKTHVLGTSFSVSSYTGALHNTITVTRGKVQVGNNGAVLGYLLPNQALEYSTQTGKAKIVNTKATDVVAWRAGKLAFVDMPLQDIVVHLQNWYGVKYQFKNKAVLAKRFTASFNNNVSLDDLLAVLNEIDHARYKFNSQSKTIIDY